MKLDPVMAHRGLVSVMIHTRGKGEFSDFQLSLDNFWFMILHLDPSPEYFST